MGHVLSSVAVASAVIAFFFIRAIRLDARENNIKEREAAEYARRRAVADQYFESLKRASSRVPGVVVKEESRPEKFRSSS